MIENYQHKMGNLTIPQTQSLMCFGKTYLLPLRVSQQLDLFLENQSFSQSNVKLKPENFLKNEKKLKVCFYPWRLVQMKKYILILIKGKMSTSSTHRNNKLTNFQWSRVLYRNILLDDLCCTAAFVFKII